MVSSCPVCHHKDRVTGRKTEGRFCCWFYMGAAIFDQMHGTCVGARFSIRLVAKANDLCTRLAGAISGEEEKDLREEAANWIAAEAWVNFLNFCGVWVKKESMTSPEGFPGTRQDFRFCCTRAEPREENEWHHWWNVNWSISDAEEQVNPYSSFFDYHWICSFLIIKPLNIKPKCLENLTEFRCEFDPVLSAF